MEALLVAEVAVPVVVAGKSVRVDKIRDTMKRDRNYNVGACLCGGTAFSQSQLDAFKYSQTELNGTARYLGMGGAFGALGGDISAMNTNPAGLAIYKSSEVVTTLSLSSASAKTDWLVRRWTTAVRR